MNLISAYLQEGVSIGPWGTGLSVTNLYNSSMFLSETQTTSFTRTSDTDHEDFFFAGDIGAANITLPGMRLEGGCTPVVVDPGVNIDPSTFDEHCNSLPNGTRQNPQSIAARGFTMGMMGCTNTSFSGFASGNSTTHPDIGYFYYNYTQESGAGDFSSGQGLIECHATVSTGYAFLRGDNKTFSSFVPAPFFDSATSNLGGEPLSHPLYAAWDGLLRVALSTGNYDSEARIQGFGIRAQDNSSELGTVIYSFPSEDIVAQRLWSAIAHNTAGIATLSWSNNTAYDATTTSLVSAYVRVQPYAKIAYVLLGHWFALLCLVTVFGYRKSFARSLDGYVAASLVVKGGSELVVDQPYGSSDSNPLLMERFTPERLF